MKVFLKTLTKNRYLIIVLFTAFLLRFVNLGYSNYQGDEIKAFFLPSGDQTVSEFLLNQRKGPVQFLVTFILKLFDATYSNRFFVRIPFALAGFLSVYFFYKLISHHFGEKVGFFASFFFATNGFLIAFSRIVQYQSFVILFMVLALYMFTLAVSTKKYGVWGIFLGFLFWALSILSHYDGVFIAPFALYLICTWFKQVSLPQKVKIKTLLISCLVSGALLLAFYVPFVYSVSQATADYWSGRITGDVSAKLSSSRYLFSVYQPIYVIHIYTVLALIGFVVLIQKSIPAMLFLLSKPIAKLKFKRSEIFISSITKFFIEKVFGTSFAYLSILVWVLIPLIFLEVFVHIPGTHIYTYLVPVFILLGLGIDKGLKVSSKISKQKSIFLVTGISIFVVFAFIFAQAHTVFVDHTTEYPWREKKFLIWSFPEPTPIFHLSMFGFPYYRNWEGVENFIKVYPDVNAYSTNERKSIARYHIPLSKDADMAGFYVFIKDPQSFTNEILSKKADYWASKYTPVYTYSKNGETLTRVYLMETGSLTEILGKGY